MALAANARHAVDGSKTIVFDADHIPIFNLPFRR
jgi:hypothetical protein